MSTLAGSKALVRLLSRTVDDRALDPDLPALRARVGVLADDDPQRVLPGRETGRMPVVVVMGALGDPGVDLARLLALVHTAMADAGIACWESKYVYRFWRPVGGIREADTDGNPDTIADPEFSPLGAPASNTNPGVNFTPPFPAYASGHGGSEARCSRPSAGSTGRTASASLSSPTNSTA